MVTLQDPVPEHTLQPEKVEPVDGVAVKVTGVPELNASEQSVPQEMPAGLLVTVPWPLTCLVTPKE